MYPERGQDYTQVEFSNNKFYIHDRQTYGEFEQVTHGDIQRVQVLLYGYVNGGH